MRCVLTTLPLTDRHNHAVMVHASVHNGVSLCIRSTAHVACSAVYVERSVVTWTGMLCIEQEACRMVLHALLLGSAFLLLVLLSAVWILCAVTSILQSCLSLLCSLHGLLPLLV